MDCPFRGGNPLIKILKCTGEGAELQPINLEDVFDELLVSGVPEYIVRKYQSLAVIDDEGNVQ